MPNFINRKYVKLISIFVIITFVSSGICYSRPLAGGNASMSADEFLSPPSMSSPIYYDDLDLVGKLAFSVMTVLSDNPGLVDNASEDDNLRIDIGEDVVEIYAPQSTSFDVSQDEDFEGIKKVQILKASSGDKVFYMSIFYRNDGKVKFHVTPKNGFSKYLQELMERGVGLTDDSKSRLLSKVAEDGVESYVGLLDISVQAVDSFLRNSSVGLNSLADSFKNFVKDKGVRFTDRPRYYVGKLTISEKDDKKRAIVLLEDLLSRRGQDAEVREIVSNIFSTYWDGYVSADRNPGFDLARVNPEAVFMFRRLSGEIIQNEGSLVLDDEALYGQRFPLEGVSSGDVDEVLDSIREAFQKVAQHDIDDHNELYSRGKERAEEIIRSLSGERDELLAEGIDGSKENLASYIGLDGETIGYLKEAGLDTVGKVREAGILGIANVPGVTHILKYIADHEWTLEEAWTDEKSMVERIDNRSKSKARMIKDVCDRFLELNLKSGGEAADLPVDVLLGVRPEEIKGLEIYNTPDKVRELGVEGLLSTTGLDIISVEVEYGIMAPAKKRPIDPGNYYEFPGMVPEKIKRGDLSDAIVPTEIGTSDKEFIFNNNFLRLMAKLHSKLSGDNGEMLLYESYKGNDPAGNPRWKYEQLLADGAPSLGSIWDGIRFGISVHNVRGHFPINDWGFPILNADESVAQGVRGGTKHLYGNLVGLMYYLIVLAEGNVDDPEERARAFMSNRKNAPMFRNLSQKQKYNLPIHLVVLYSHRFEMGALSNPFDPWPNFVGVNDTKAEVLDRIKKRYPNAVIGNEGLSREERMGDRYNLVFEHIFSQSDDVNASGIAAALAGEGVSRGEVEHVLEELFALGLINKVGAGDVYTRGDNTVGAGSFRRLPMTTTDKEFVLKTFAGADLSDKAVSADVFGKILENFEGEWARALIKTARSVGEQAKAGEKITHKKLVAIGNGFIRSNAEVKTDLQRLLQIMRELSNDSLEIVMQKEGETPEDFASKVVGMTSREKDAFLAEDILVMVSRDNVLLEEYMPIRSGVRRVVGPKKAFFVGVEDAALTDDSYIRITQMLRMAMGIAFNEEQVISQPGVEVEYMFGSDNEKMLIFVPKIVPVNLDNITTIYESQRSIIESA